MFNETTEQTQIEEIVPYHINAATTIDVRRINKDFWLTVEQIAKLYDCTPRNIRLHINEIYKSQELQEERTRKDFFLVRDEGGRKVSRNVPHYNIDMIVRIGFRINSVRGKIFRDWATELVKKEIGIETETTIEQNTIKQDTRTSMTAKKYPAKKIERVDLIKDLLLQKGITQKQIAKELGLHYVTVHNALYGINFCLAVENWLKENLLNDLNDVTEKSVYSEKILGKWEEAQNGNIEANETLMQMLKGFKALYDTQVA